MYLLMTLGSLLFKTSINMLSAHLHVATAQVCLRFLSSTGPLPAAVNQTQILTRPSSWLRWKGHLKNTLTLFLTLKCVCVCLVFICIFQLWKSSSVISTWQTTRHETATAPMKISQYSNPTCSPLLLSLFPHSIHCPVKTKSKKCSKNTFKKLFLNLNFYLVQSCFSILRHFIPWVHF